MLGFETTAPHEPPRSRRRLVAGLVLGGVLLGLAVAGGASVIGRYVQATTASGPTAPPVPRETPALAGLACGDPTPAGEGDPERTLVVETEIEAAAGARFRPGASVPLRLALVNVGPDLTIRAASDIVVVATRDGAVVGAPAAVELRNPDERRRDPYLLDVPSGIGVPAQAAYQLVSCDGGALFAGEYALTAAFVVTDADGGARRELVALPVPITVE